MMTLALFGVAFGCERIDAASVIDDVGAKVAEGQPADGLGAIERVWDQLPDACSPVGHNDLALLAHRAGSLAWDLGRLEVSDQWFESACRMVPDAQVPDSLGPTAAERRVAACRRVAANSSGSVVAESAVILDGVPLDAGVHLTVPFGVHLLVWSEGGAWRGRWQTVEEGLEVAVPNGSLVPTRPTDTSSATATSDRKTHPKLGVPVVLVGTGSALAAGGGVVMEALFAERWNQHCTGIGYVRDGWRLCQEQRGVALAPGFYGGLGLIAGGTAIGLAGVGLGFHALLTDDAAGLVVTGSL
jgi:hypothetical protein